MSAPLPLEKFAALDAIPQVAHAFLGRVPGLDVQVDREEALRRLDFRYLDERTFTYNGRKDTDSGRFEVLLRRAVGRRLTWAEMTAQA